MSAKGPHIGSRDTKLSVGDFVLISHKVIYPNLRGLPGRIGELCCDDTALVEVNGHWHNTWGAWPIPVEQLEKIP